MIRRKLVGFEDSSPFFVLMPTERPKKVRKASPSIWRKISGIVCPKKIVKEQKTKGM